MDFPTFLQRIPLAFLFGISLSVSAQFYAPDTDYHDRVQRLFPVEAARVLAWNSSRTSSNGITEVAYKISTSTNGNSDWQISWLDAKGKTVKSGKVEYPASLLKEGPKYYREVMRQLLAVGWSELPPMKPAEVEENFWRGATEAGINREESFDRALKLAASARTRKDATWAPELAGLLVHGALPAIFVHLTLDVMAEARSAAWLALSEKACATELPHLWSPVLFLAGREKAAVDSWSGPSTMTKPGVTDGVPAAWSLMIRGPRTKESYLFAIDTTNSAIALALMSYDERINGGGGFWAEVVSSLFGTDRGLRRLHNYAPNFVWTAGVGGGHIGNGIWPALQRAAWIDLLSRHKDLTNEGVNFADAVDKASQALVQLPQPPRDIDACLYGFKEAAPMIRFGHEQGVGKLVPTASVTARDLLNYGWEMTGFQMGARYRFVHRMWGVPEQSKPIMTAITRETQGLLPFFLTASAANSSRYQENLFRLQHVDGFQLMIGWSPNPFADSRREATNATAVVFMRRCWLRSMELDWQARSLWDVNDFPHLSELLTAVEEEGGPRGGLAAWKYLSDIQQASLSLLPQATYWKTNFAARIPQVGRLTIKTLWNELAKGRNSLEFAQELERIYWRNPDGDFADLPFSNYVYAGDLLAARRFYLQARENFLDPVSISSGIGYWGWMLGYALNDADLRRKVMVDGRSGSSADMEIGILEAALRDDRAAMKARVGELVERYESKSGPDSNGRRLGDFLPLLPALADPKNPKHQEAIDYFGRDATWTILRWIWVEKFKLSRDDAIAFLGGRDTDRFRDVLVAYLDGDKTATSKAADDLLKQNRGVGTGAVIARHLQQKIKNFHPPEAPDLKPKDALSARAAVLKRLEEKSHQQPSHQ